VHAGLEVLMLQMRGVWLSSAGQRYLAVQLVADNPVDVVRHRHVLVGDTAFGVRDQRESHCPPTDIDVRVMVLGFRVLAHSAHGVYTAEEGRKLDRPAQCALVPLPAIEVRQCGVYLLIR
jgi:hypothetical protein